MTGWQIMALKSGQMAYLTVEPGRVGEGQGVSEDGHLRRPRRRPIHLYARRHGWPSSEDYERATTAIGLLCQQYMHMPRTDPAMVEGTSFLMQNPPDTGVRNSTTGTMPPR